MWSASWSPFTVSSSLESLSSVRDNSCSSAMMSSSSGPSSLSGAFCFIGSAASEASLVCGDHSVLSGWLLSRVVGEVLFRLMSLAVGVVGDALYDVGDVRSTVV